MLKEFGVKNFLSFKDELRLSMIPSKGTRLSNHIVYLNNNKILKNTAIFGANASGKTNFVKAIYFFKDLVLKGFDNSKIEKKFFRLGDSYYKELAYFFIDFMYDGIDYNYSFSFSYSDRIIYDEKLDLKIKKTAINVFTRKFNDQKIKISSDYPFEIPDDQSRFNVYSSDFQNSEDEKMKKTFFLSDTARRCPSTSQYFKNYINVIKWLINVIVIFPDSKYGSLNQLIDSEQRKEFIEIINNFDLDICKIGNEELNFAELFNDMNQKDAEDIKNDILNELEKHQIMAKIKDNIATISKDKKGNIKVTKMKLAHKEEKYLFDLNEESDGTQRLFDLIPLFFLKGEKVIVIDELDRSLHTKVVKKFIELFFEKNSNNKAQFIFTTHDVNLLDLDLLRQDEIRFMNRGNQGESYIKSLNDYNVRFDKKLLREYLIGEYGGIPKF